MSEEANITQLLKLAFKISKISLGTLQTRLLANNKTQTFFYFAVNVTDCQTASFYPNPSRWSKSSSK